MNDRSKTAFVESCNAKLREWDLKIRKLESEAQAASADAQIAINKQIEKLKSSRRQAARKVDEVQSASDAAWRDIKDGIDGAWRSMEDAFKKVAGRIG